jgi:hypothetical protein
MLATQVLYHFSHTKNPFCFSVFSGKASLLPCHSGTVYFPISTSLIAGISGITTMPSPTISILKKKQIWQ